MVEDCRYRVWRRWPACEITERRLPRQLLLEVQGASLVASPPPLPPLGRPSTLGTSSPVPSAPGSGSLRPSPRGPPGVVPAGCRRAGVGAVVVSDAPGGSGGHFRDPAEPGGVAAEGGADGGGVSGAGRRHGSAEQAKDAPDRPHLGHRRVLYSHGER